MSAYITHADCLRHEMVPGHPECPERISTIESHLSEAGLLDRLHRYEAPRAEKKHLAPVHTARHIDAITNNAPARGLAVIDPDTAMNPHTLDAALRAAGALVLATDLVISGRERTAFCNVRPPGHHAERDQAMGFCFFNNVAVGVAHALDACRLKRVAVVDFDVHHGNGTEDIFVNDERVMVCSSFQFPLYPYKAGTSVPGHLLNVRLPAGAGGKEFRAAIAEAWFPEIEAFRPELFFFSAGFDAHREDPLAGLNFVEDDYAWITGAIRRYAHEYAGGRMVSTLEGGYALPALGRSAVAHVQALLT